MTLSYWWMHWFWITFRLCLAVSEEVSEISTHSTPPVATPDFGHRTGKAIGILNANPPNNSSPSNSSMTKYHKPSFKKLDFVNANMTKQNTTNNKLFPNKDVPVINQNSTDYNLTDSQLINSNFSGANHSENFSYVNETSYNQSLLFNSEKIMEITDDVSGNLSAAGITGITLGCIIIVGMICGVSYFIYRHRGFIRPQVLNDHCSNPDSSGYIDDASVRDNSEEMYSLDNDSFLNSLEAMTIQNYWTDTVKHTKL